MFLYDTADKKLSEHQAQVSEMQKAVEMNNDLFQAGKATYLEIITAQQSLLSAQLNEVSDTFQRYAGCYQSVQRIWAVDVNN